MVVEIILAFVIGYLVAPNKKIGFLLGLVAGAIWGVLATHLVFAMEGRRMDGAFLVIMIVVEGLFTGLLSLGTTHAKMKKKAKSMQGLTQKFD